MAIVVSCLADGLLLVDGDRIELVDRLPTAGLADGLRVARARHDPGETAVAAEIVLEGGRRLAVPGLADPHDLAWDGDLLAAVSTLRNEVVWVDGAGRTVRRHRAPGEGDCWHLSGLCVDGDRALVTAFGCFRRHRDWALAERRGAGLVLELSSGRVLLAGLSSPHSPRLVDGRLAVCDSGRGDLLVGDRRLRLGGWTRGIAVTCDHLVVGVSAPRGSRRRAHLAFLRRSDLALERRVELPVREVFDLVALDPGRARELAVDDAEPRPMGALRPNDLRAEIVPLGRLVLRAGALATLTCSVSNHAREPLATRPPHPVSVAAGWGGEGRTLWSPLPAELGPGARALVRVRVLAPERPGAHRLRLDVVQEGVGVLGGGAEAEVLVA